MEKLGELGKKRKILEVKKNAAQEARVLEKQVKALEDQVGFFLKDL